MQEKARKIFHIYICIFFCLCFWTEWHLVGSKLPILEISEVYNWMELVFTMLPLLFFVYAFAAVCSGLKESRSAMFALRISSIYVLLHYLRQMLLTGIHNVTLIVIGVLVIFVCKLFFSSGLRALFPKESRKLGVLGWIGILLYSLPFILLITVGVQYIDARRFSKAVDVESLNMTGNEVSDGLMLFRPMESWQLDSTSTRDYPYTSYHYTDDEDKVRVISSIAEYGTERKEHIWFINDESEISPKYYVSQIDNYSEKLDKKVIYIDTYLYTINYQDVRWTYATVYYENCEKSLSLSVLDYAERDFSREIIRDFLLDAEFDLRPRLAEEQGIDDIIDSNDY